MVKKTLLFLITFIGFSFISNAQVSESCNCTVDTLGYASYLQTLTLDENAVFQYHVSGNFAVAYGIIGSSTPSVVQNLIDNYPLVTTIIMQACMGSENDDANLVASMKIYNHGFTMYLPDNGYIASGAVDMFLAGSSRVVDATFEPVGVHSWSDGVHDASYYPVGDSVHQPYIDYYMNIGFTQQVAEDFYYFTIYAASGNDVHWMTDAEIDQYKIRTCKYSNNPNYSITENGSVLSADLSNASYQWLNCDNNYSIINGETNQSFTPNTNGNYAVYVAETGWADTSACYYYNSLSANNLSKGNFLKVIYPNPSKKNITLEFNNTQDKIKIELIDITGKTVFSSTNINTNKITFNPELTRGTYVLKTSSNDLINKRVIIIK